MCAFYDPDESEFYGMCVEDYLLRENPVIARCGHRVLELGVGSGRAMCGVLKRVDFTGVIDGYELDPESCRLATEAINELGLSSKYRVTNADFFEAAQDISDTSAAAIANPPYLPSHDGSPAYPVLSGGVNGNAVTERIIGSKFAILMVMLSSFADPVHTIEFASACGYSLVRWIAKPLRMGPYSSAVNVRNRIHELVADGRAFVRRDSYLIVGVTFIRDPIVPVRDVSERLIAVLRAFAQGSLVPAAATIDGWYDANAVDMVVPGTAILTCDGRDGSSNS